MQEIAKKWLVEQHKNNQDKAHIYFYSPIPFPKKPADSVIGLEIKGSGEHGIAFCFPSIHKDELQNTISNLFHHTIGLGENNVDIFNNIYGRDDIKYIIQLAIKSDQPVHVLLTGEPGCGKTQFLENIKVNYRDKAYFTIGAHSTKAGMLDYLFEKRPRIILIDEIEHMPAKDQAVLLSLMQSQMLSETKYRKTRQTQLKCSIFATSNSTKKMLDPLLSRFVIIKVEKYNYEEFKEVAMQVLTEREFIEDENLASAMVTEVWQRTSEKANIRDVIKIARLAKNMNDIDLMSKTIFS